MWMPEIHLRDQQFKHIEHVEVGSRVEIGGRQGGGRVQDYKMTNSRSCTLVLSQTRLDRFGDIKNLALTAGLDVEAMHGEIVNAGSPAKFCKGPESGDSASGLC